MAKAVAEAWNVAFVRTQTSDVFAEYDLDPSEPMSFDTRLWIQHKIIDAAEQVWAAEGGDFVTDRTPLDMLAYTLADIRGDTEVKFDDLAAYVQRCYESTGEHFSRLIIVQPGIPLVFEEGKAALNQAYIEHLNTTVTGLVYDERQPLDATTMPRNVLDMQDRLDFVREELEDI
jgi:hypothetical protein